MKSKTRNAPILFKKRTTINEMSRIIYIRHSLLKKYDIHIIQYCILVFLIRVSSKYEYCKIKKGFIANFLAIPNNKFSYHFNELKKLNFLEEESGKGIRIINLECKKDLNPYLELKGSTYSLVDFALLSKLKITHFQYCLLHSIFVTKHMVQNLEHTSLQSITLKLNASRGGIDKAIRKLEERKLLLKGTGSLIELSNELVTEFEQLHYLNKNEIASNGEKRKSSRSNTF